MPSRARERGLAKQAARRQAERKAAKRRRDMILGGIGAVAGIALIVVGVMVFTGDDAGTSATPTPTPGVSSSTGSPAPKGEPQQTGTVAPAVEPPPEVACGGARPDAASEPKPQYDAAPDPKSILKDGVDYTATIATSCGKFTVDLYEEQAPKAVASFVFLAGEGFFDGLTFHRILPGFVIQGGDPLGSGTGGAGAGYLFADEFDPKLRFDHAGALAMAHPPTPDSNGSQWFVTLADDSATHLNDVHTIFGDVTDGIDVVQRIAAVPLADAENGVPSQAVYIDSVTISPKG